MNAKQRKRLDLQRRLDQQRQQQAQQPQGRLPETSNPGAGSHPADAHARMAKELAEVELRRPEELAREPVQDFDESEAQETALRGPAEDNSGSQLSPEAVGGDLPAYWGRVKKLDGVLHKLQRDLATEEELVAAEKANLQLERDQIEHDRVRLESDLTALEVERSSSLEEVARLEALRLQEVTGFLASKRDALDALTLEGEALLTSMAQARSTHLEELAGRIQGATESITEIENSLLTQLKEVVEGKASAMEGQADNDLREARLTSRERSAEREINRRVDAAVAELREDLTEALEAKSRFQKANTELREELSALRDREEAQADGARLTQENHDLRTKLGTLRDELDRRPEEYSLAEMEAAKSARDQFARDLAAANSENSDLRRRIDRFLAADADIEQMRDAVQTARQLSEGYRAQLADLRQQLSVLTGDLDNKPAFPALMSMDRDLALQEKPTPRRASRRASRGDELATLVKRLQVLLANGTEGPNGELVPRLRFAENDLRTFLAGLASSPLMVIQGISGTGKTSLPETFAKVTGANVDVIEVAAGWREPQDLIGYFNSFERVFHETPALKALYRASCPAESDGINIVVLDEMNLSHPEQYFSDFLSALERTDRSRRIGLRIPANVTQVPDRLREDGTIEVPQNVWFVGTINRDETTVALADKTYDRAHIMELPVTPPNAIPNRQPEPFTTPLAYSELRGYFDSAITSGQNSAEKVLRIFEHELRAPLADSFGVGWGNRLPKMIAAFVPVLVACGGDEGYAADQILVTKVLRKVEGRFDVKKDDLELLRELVLSSWETLGPGVSPPTSSVHVLTREIDRLDRL